MTFDKTVGGMGASWGHVGRNNIKRLYKTLEISMHTKVHKKCKGIVKLIVQGNVNRNHIFIDYGKTIWKKLFTQKRKERSGRCRPDIWGTIIMASSFSC